MHQDALLPDPVAVVGVNFEVKHRLFAATVEVEDPLRSSFHAHPFADQQALGSHPVVPVGAPNRVEARDPERFRLSLDPEIVHHRLRVAEDPRDSSVGRDERLTGAFLPGSEDRGLRPARRLLQDRSVRDGGQ